MPKIPKNYFLDQLLSSALNDLNSRSNSIEPYKLDRIYSIKESNGLLVVEVGLKMLRRDFRFRLVLDKSNKQYPLKEFKQLAP